jgi:16S rRNA (guanine1207-N2)-methyltransferase
MLVTHQFSVILSGQASMLPLHSCWDYDAVMAGIPLDEDSYYKKTITFKAWKHSLLFRTSQELFSSDDIDLGTRFLLRTIVEADYPRFRQVLDLGCGYGPLGLTLASLYGCGLHMVDRDALAVAYAGQNARLNGLDDTGIYGSLGYDDVTHRNFDLIVSNLPGKAGGPVMAHFLREAAYYLIPEGLVAVVVVAPLEEHVSNVLDSTPGVEIMLRRSRPGHCVYHYRFLGTGYGAKPTRSALERGMYQRNDISFRYGGIEYAMRTAYGLPEFDTLAYGTEMVFAALAGLPKTTLRHVVIVNPGQGHVPVFLWRLLQPQTITLAGRDLLALRYSALNLENNGFPPEKLHYYHQVGLGLTQQEKADIVVVMLGEEGVAADSQTVRQVAGLVSSRGSVVISANSTAITRLIAVLKTEPSLHIQSRDRLKGYSILVLRRN